ncbi:MAG: transposase [Ignavibacteriales bacterium]|nr:transposase [Ignavibacteriales bacterium]
MPLVLCGVKLTFERQIYMEIIRVAIGIDISSEKFDVCLSTMTKEGEVIVGVSAEFPNTMPGFRKFSKWVDKVNKEKKLPLVYLMEATGSYHEELAYYLHQRDCHDYSTSLKVEEVYAIIIDQEQDR